MALEKPITVICPNGHLSYARLEKGSFESGLKSSPDAVCADAGSNDVGPYPLGSDTCTSPEEWQRHDIREMLLASRKLGVPMIIGSANDCGTNKGVDKFIRIVKEVAKENSLPPFTLASIRCTLNKQFVQNALTKGARITGLDGRSDLTQQDIDKTDNMIAVMGAEPIQRAVEGGADVIITSRTSDCCIFAGFALAKGASKDMAYYFGKVMECASFCAEPYMGKESIIGTVGKDYVTVEACHPGQRCTPASLAGHAMYERKDPYFEAAAGGTIDMRACKYEQVAEKATKVTGQKFIESKEYFVKLEGSGRVGDRRYLIVGIRDPMTIKTIEKAIEWAKGKVTEQFGENGKEYHLFYHVYGKNAILGDMEPVKETKSHELCVVVEAVAENPARADLIVTLGARSIFYARLKTKGTAGGAALLTDEALEAKPVYRWTMNHIIKIDDPYVHFPITYEKIGAK